MPSYNVVNGNAIEGTSVNGRGLVGHSTKDYAIRGHSDESAGIRGSSDAGPGVEGWGTKGAGVIGTSTTSEGVRGISQTDSAGVVGVNEFLQRVQPGIIEHVAGGPGVYGESKSGPGVQGESKSGPGVYGESKGDEGVRGVSHSAGHAAIVGHNRNPAGIAIYGKGGRLAGFFDGDVEVSGDIRFVSNHGDCAENFDAAETAEPGSVMVLNEHGALRESHQAYDKRVAGVVSGAGPYKPALVLDAQASQTIRVAIGLMGKVYCKVDAQQAPIEVGDLLTTSPTRGHAMKASDPLRAFGSVIGKALGAVKDGRGMIPILIALQ